MGLTLGAVALLAALADTARLFLKSANHTAPALIVWALWTAALFTPLVWALRDRARQRSYLVLGYVLVALALRVVEVSITR